MKTYYEMLLDQHNTNNNEFSTKTGIKASTLQYFKTYKKFTDCKVKTVKQIADGFGMTVDELLQGEQNYYDEIERNKVYFTKYIVSENSFYVEKKAMNRYYSDIFSKSEYMKNENSQYVNILFDTEKDAIDFINKNVGEIEEFRDQYKITTYEINQYKGTINVQSFNELINSTEEDDNGLRPNELIEQFDAPFYKIEKDDDGDYIISIQ